VHGKPSEMDDTQHQMAGRGKSQDCPVHGHRQETKEEARVRDRSRDRGRTQVCPVHGKRSYGDQTLDDMAQKYWQPKEVGQQVADGQMLTLLVRDWCMMLMSVCEHMVCVKCGLCLVSSV